MTGVLTYNPADMTVSSEGTLLRSSRRNCPERTTWRSTRPGGAGRHDGGLIATADSVRCLDLRFPQIRGSARRWYRTVARTGGHVIKNVAGYDLAKLLHGSYGTLGLLAEVVLRLHPIPTATRTVRVELPLSDAARKAASVLRGQREPVSLEWFDGQLVVRFEGTVEGTRTRARQLAAELGGTVLDEDTAAATWARHAELVRQATVRLGIRPSRLVDVLTECGCADGARATVGLGTGVATVTVSDSDVERVHDITTAAGGVSVLRRAVPGARAWGQTPSAVRVLRAVKNELDPNRRLCPGRLDSWLEERKAKS